MTETVSLKDIIEGVIHNGIMNWFDDEETWSEWGGGGSDIFDFYTQHAEYYDGVYSKAEAIAILDEAVNAGGKSLAIAILDEAVTHYRWRV